jgi:hypothetical protein
VDGSETSIQYLHPNLRNLKDDCVGRDDMINKMVNDSDYALKNPMVSYPQWKGKNPLVGGAPLGLYPDIYSFDYEGSIWKKNFLDEWRGKVSKYGEISIQKIEDFKEPVRYLLNRYKDSFIWVSDGHGPKYCYKDDDSWNKWDSCCTINDDSKCEKNYDEYNLKESVYYRPTLWAAKVPDSMRAWLSSKGFSDTSKFQDLKNDLYADVWIYGKDIDAQEVVARIKDKSGSWKDIGRIAKTGDTSGGGKYRAFYAGTIKISDYLDTNKNINFRLDVQPEKTTPYSANITGVYFTKSGVFDIDSKDSKNTADKVTSLIETDINQIRTNSLGFSEDSTTISKNFKGYSADTFKSAICSIEDISPCREFSIGIFDTDANLWVYGEKIAPEKIRLRLLNSSGNWDYEMKLASFEDNSGISTKKAFMIKNFSFSAWAKDAIKLKFRIDNNFSLKLPLATIEKVGLVPVKYDENYVNSLLQNGKIDDLKKISWGFLEQNFTIGNNTADTYPITSCPRGNSGCNELEMSIK